MGWALAGFLVAGISDGVDGFIARQFNQRTELGAYLDPMADKLLLVSVFVVLGFMGELPLWLVIAAVSRDALIVCAVLLSTDHGQSGRDEAAFVSKANTAVQIVLAAIVLAELAFAHQLRACAGALAHNLSGLLTVASAGGLSRRLAEAHERLWRRPRPSTDDRPSRHAPLAAAFRRQIRFWLTAIGHRRSCSSICSATSCCRSWPAWCLPISSIRSPTGCSGSACRG